MMTILYIIFYFFDSFSFDVLAIKITDFLIYKFLLRFYKFGLYYVRLFLLLVYLIFLKDLCLNFFFSIKELAEILFLSTIMIKLFIFLSEIKNRPFQTEPPSISASPINVIILFFFQQSPFLLLSIECPSEPESIQNNFLKIINV